jgi:hypothetical protein
MCKIVIEAKQSLRIPGQDWFAFQMDLAKTPCVVTLEIYMSFPRRQLPATGTGDGTSGTERGSLPAVPGSKVPPPGPDP